MKQIIAIIFILSAGTVFAAESAPQTAQSNSMLQSILSRETNPEHASGILAISERIDRIYSGLYGKLKEGKKIRIFMDPVHGKIKTPSGSYDWQGSLTWRKSTTGVPEEIYSIPIARLMYKKLTESGYFEVVSTPDYLEVLKGHSDSYLDINFDETAALANKAEAFIVIAEHLNNISPINKADGFVNLNGVHLTCNERRAPLISYINGIYHGYLSFVSRYDATGMSYAIGEGFRDRMTALGHEANSWEKGVVSDDTFSVYVNFPVTVLYESGFISNPEEEKLLKDETYQETIAECQFEGILSAIENKFGVDLSTSSPSKKKDTDQICIDIIKLEQIICYYVQKGEFSKAVSSIENLERITADSGYRNRTSAFSGQKNRIRGVMAARNTGAAYLMKKQYAKAYKAYQSAVSQMGYFGIFNGIRDEIYAENNIAARAIGKYELHYSYPMGGQREVYPPDMTNLRAKIESHSIKTPYIVTIEKNQSLEDAVDASIAPSEDQKIKIISALKNGNIAKSIYKKVYSKKSRKNVYQRSVVYTKPEFYPGIYIVSFDTKLGLKSVLRTNSVQFDPNKYQNQLYFKNSCLAERVKEKTL